MCEEVLEEIETAISANQVLSRYVQTSNFFTGTFYEKGWDLNYWYQTLTSTSYQDPRDVLQYLALTQQCALSDLFTNQQGCHEQEMIPSSFFFMKEVSKIYNDIELAEINIAGQPVDVFNGNVPFGWSTNPHASPNDPPLYGGFIVTKNLANRFSPCGRLGCIDRWTNTPSLNPNTEEATSNSWDDFTQPSYRNNPNVRSNIPYYYFGIKPGATALDLLRGKFFRK